MRLSTKQEIIIMSMRRLLKEQNTVSLIEVASDLKLPLGTAYGRMVSLIRKGIITKEPHKNNSFSLTEKWRQQ